MRRALFGSAPEAKIAGRETQTAPDLMADTLCEVQLSPERSVSFATEPGGEQLEQHAYAGLARFSVSPPGTYRLSVDQPLWLDVMLKGQVIAAKDFQAHAGCNAPHQVVEFDLPFADALSVQISAATASSVRLALTPAPAPPPAPLATPALTPQDPPPAGNTR